MGSFLLVYISSRYLNSSLDTRLRQLKVSNFIFCRRSIERRISTTTVNGSIFSRKYMHFIEILIKIDLIVLNNQSQTIEYDWIPELRNNCRAGQKRIKRMATLNDGSIFPFWVSGSFGWPSSYYKKIVSWLTLRSKQCQATTIFIWKRILFNAFLVIIRTKTP